MKIITASLSGAALDWAVATIEGLPVRKDPMNIDGDYIEAARGAFQDY
mgnify:CR=1 FL=1